MFQCHRVCWVTVSRINIMTVVNFRFIYLLILFLCFNSLFNFFQMAPVSGGVKCTYVWKILNQLLSKVNQPYVPWSINWILWSDCVTHVHYIIVRRWACLHKKTLNTSKYLTRALLFALLTWSWRLKEKWCWRCLPV